MPLPAFADPGSDALPLHLVTPSELAGWCAGQDPAIAAWIAATGFAAAAGDMRLIPGAGGTVAAAVFGLGDSPRRRGRFLLAKAAAALPAGDWTIATPLPVEGAEEAALGWLLAQYRFDRYRSGAEKPVARLVPPPGIDAARIALLAECEALTRDLINTPANDLGPEELEAAIRSVAAEFGAEVRTIAGAELAQGFPLIQAVGGGSARPPRLIDLRWGTAGPRLTLVGKGVCFDTGGLDLKPSTGMLLMKKDMGGAATALGLARAIMGLGLPLRLRLLVPAVENAVSGTAFRPKDILRSRQGLTVEVNNTDAEGRLILADALALAAEEAPDLLISLATLTGAARVALGPDLAPFFTDDEALAAALSAGAGRACDAVWRLPFWDGYEEMIEPGIADLDNAPTGGFAGAITAALFLRRFAGAGRYAHFDIYGWQPTAAPARPKGGVGQGARAILAALPEVLGL